MKPLLATADKILPYLKRIDENRYYSNVGPLVLEFEKRIEELFECPAVTTSSCTSGLTACLLALNLPKGSFVACPSWTFVATAAAIVAAGLQPYFVDVLESSWAMTWASHNTSAVLVVSPFGAPINVHGWDEYSELSGKPVIIDAAAGFDTFSSVCKVGKSPVVISTHATKVFGTGEGGLVLCQDETFLSRVRSISNFGMDANRNISLPGLNAKMSEYAAAVGLAELDWWEEKRLRWLGVKYTYMEEFRNITKDSPIMDTRWAGNVFPIVLPEVDSDQLISKLSQSGILCRKWIPVHTYEQYKNYPRNSLIVTEYLDKHVLMLPFSIDQTREEIEKIKAKLCE